MKHLEELRRLQEIHAPEQLKERTLAAIEKKNQTPHCDCRYRCCSLLYRSRQRKPGFCTRSCGYSGAGRAGTHCLRAQ